MPQIESWSCSVKPYLKVKVNNTRISDLHTRVTTTCRALLLDLASDLLLLLALRLGAVYHLSWDVLLWTLPLGVIWRQSCSLKLMAFLLTFSWCFMPRARGCGSAFWMAPGLMTLHCISARLLVSRFLTLSFVIVYYYIFYRFIAKRLRPLPL